MDLDIDSSSTPNDSNRELSDDGWEDVDYSKDLTVYNCNHYKRSCFFVSPCCEEIFPCRICHDEKSDHVMNRYNVNEIVCSQCNTRCISCNITFGKYFCPICHLYDNTDKEQFHCDGCGLCRVGGRNNFFHCYTCGMCLPLSLLKNHKCIQNNSHQNCPVCLENIHTSRDTTNVSKCGHLMHSQCYKRYLLSDYRCPVCGVTMVNMDQYWKVLDNEIEKTPMPHEYANQKRWILCKDCREVSNTMFHIVGMKCVSCGSYNTCTTSAPIPNESEV